MRIRRPARRSVAAFALACLPALAAAPGPPLPRARSQPERTASPRTVRALWVTRWDFRTATQVRAILRNAASLGLNRVYFQARGRADAFYRSRLEPWGEELGPGDPGFDPLALACEEADRSGLELHAWVNVLAGWKGRHPPRDPEHIVHRHPDWFLKDRWGERHLLDEHYTIVNPCRPEVRSHIRAVIGDIARRYPVDGVHLDYVRFIAQSKKERQAVPYDPKTLSRFRDLTGGFPVRYPEAWDRFRRRAVSRLVQEITTEVRRVRPEAVLSAAVVRDLERGHDRYFQDGPAWVREGWIDELVIMNYERESEDFARYLDAARARVNRDRLICGVGAYLLRDPEEIARQLALALRRGVRGYALFAYASFYATPSHAVETGRDAAQRRTARRHAVRTLHHRLLQARASGPVAAGDG